MSRPKLAIRVIRNTLNQSRNGGKWCKIEQWVRVHCVRSHLAVDLFMYDVTTSMPLVPWDDAARGSESLGSPCGEYSVWDI